MKRQITVLMAEFVEATCYEGRLNELFQPSRSRITICRQIKRGIIAYIEADYYIPISEKRFDKLYSENRELTRDFKKREQKEEDEDQAKKRL